MNVDDYLQNGIHGTKQTNPDERRKFLGTIRERIVIALTRQQVLENGVYREIEDCIKQHTKATLLLNGDLSYDYLTKYIEIANKYKCSFSIVTQHESSTEVGLVLAEHDAIDKEDIFVTEKKETEGKDTPKQQSFLSKLKKAFVRKTS